MNDNVPEISLKIVTVEIKSKCKTCNNTPLALTKWFEGHWGCTVCGDPNIKK